MHPAAHDVKHEPCSAAVQSFVVFVGLCYFHVRMIPFCPLHVRLMLFGKAWLVLTAIIVQSSPIEIRFAWLYPLSLPSAGSPLTFSNAQYPPCCKHIPSNGNPRPLPVHIRGAKEFLAYFRALEQVWLYVHDESVWGCEEMPLEITELLRRVDVLEGQIALIVSINLRSSDSIS